MYSIGDALSALSEGRVGESRLDEGFTSGSVRGLRKL